MTPQLAAAAMAPVVPRDLLASDGRRLRTIAIGVGLCWSVLFVVLALRFELQAYGDGSIFSYSVAVQDAWAFHWHNISGRLFVYLFCMAPAELYVWLTGDAQGGIVLYGLLFYIAPLLGLAATFAADRSQSRVIFGYACVSTACLCPLVFGFPTEMWMAHALFWPALALCHYASRGIVGTIAILLTLLALVFTHGGGVVFAFVILATVAARGPRDPALRRTGAVLMVVMAIWIGVKVLLPPDAYFDSILPAAAMNFIDLGILACPMSLLLLSTLVGYGLAFAVTSRLSPARAALYAAVLTATALAVYWLCFDHWLHAENRYYLRTGLFIATPALAVAAAIHALHAEARLGPFEPLLSRLTAAATTGAAARALVGALLLTMLVHAVETGKFVVAWSAYKTAIEKLAEGTASDPSLGDTRFVSSSRIAARLAPLSWSSTTQYLSVLLTPGFAPKRLVIDPTDDYFWITCETASENARAPRAVPAQSRSLIGLHACMHRPRRIVMAPVPKSQVAPRASARASAIR